MYSEPTHIQWGFDINLQLVCNYESFPFSIRPRFLFSNNLGSIGVFPCSGHDEALFA